VADGQVIAARVRGRGRVEFAGVGFCYPGAAADVIDGLSFTAGPGRVLAITGPSGAGKSTVARLLLRFHDPDRGHIRLDGVDLRDLLHTLAQGRTLIVITHDVTLAAAADDVLVLGSRRPRRTLADR